MKKIVSFITALIISAVVVAVFHCSISGNLEMNSKTFNMWSNQYKNLSHSAVADNIGDKTMMVFGSSEFNHGKRTKYHPRNLFKKQNIDLMIVAGAYNQTLFHAIKLGAVEDKLVKRKAVLVLSPTWFYKPGVSPDNFSFRFSETDYMALMENKNISKSIKSYIGKRSELLLKKDNSMENRVKRYNKMFVDGKQNIFNKTIYNIRKEFITDRDYITVRSAVKSVGMTRQQSFQQVKNPEPINWNNLTQDAVRDSLHKKKNKFFMRDKSYYKKYRKIERKSVNRHINDSFATSPEYSDLKCFLEICKERNIEVMILVQPVNGYWYDHTGLKLDKRTIFTNNITKIASDYGAELADLSKEDYSKHFFEDAVHPDGEGWVKLNEKIYEFYNKV